MRKIYNATEINSVELFFNSKTNKTKIYFYQNSNTFDINIDGDKSKYFEHIEITILNKLNEKMFFSIDKLEQAIIERITQLEKKDKEFEERE